MCLFAWWLYSPEFGPLDWVVTFSFLIYIALGVWARWQPVAPTVIGLLLYALFLGWQALMRPDLLTVGLIFKIPIVLLLITALVLALRNGKQPSVGSP